MIINENELNEIFNEDNYKLIKRFGCKNKEDFLFTLIKIFNGDSQLKFMLLNYITKEQLQKIYKIDKEYDFFKKYQKEQQKLLNHQREEKQKHMLNNKEAIKDIIRDIIYYNDIIFIIEIIKIDSNITNKKLDFLYNCLLTIKDKGYQTSYNQIIELIQDIINETK